MTTVPPSITVALLVWNGCGKRHSRVVGNAYSRNAIAPCVQNAPPVRYASDLPTEVVQLLSCLLDTIYNPPLAGG
jgi:hypothetical protein